MTERGAELRQQTKDAIEHAEEQIKFQHDDSATTVETEHLKALLKAAKRGEMFAVTVGQYNAIRISTLEPSLERTELWERNKEKFGPQYFADLGWIWGALADISLAYEARQGKRWDELTQAEQDQSEAISFLHNWVKKLALEKWDSEEIMRDVQADAWDQGHAMGGRSPYFQTPNPYRSAS